MKADMPAVIRKRYIVKGKIQHVGYRALVMAYGESMGLKGFSRNLPDKTVEVVCEGEPKSIASFLRAIDRKGDPLEPLSINVISIEEAPPPPECELKDFVIDYGRELTPIEREAFDRDEIMVLGAGILNIKMDGVGKEVRNVGSSVREVGQKVDSMHSDMNTRFDHMAQRYDHIATSLVKAIDRMDRNSKQTDKAIEQSRKEAAASNHELAGAVKFMIKKLSDKPPRKRPPVKRKR